MDSEKIENSSSNYQIMKNFVKILHFGGGVIIFIGLLLILYPSFQTDLIISSALIISGCYMQLRFKRSVWSCTAFERLENRILKKMLPVGIRRQTDLGGKKLLSTLIGFSGVAIFAIGLYHPFIVYFSYREVWGCIFLMLGILLLTKFISKINQNEIV